MNDDIIPECGNCVCYVPIAKTNGQGGECHYNPPSVVVVQSRVLTQDGSQSHINTVFVPVPKSSWCAKFAPYPTPKADIS